MSKHETNGWPRRWVWHRWKRYRLYGPSVGTVEDPRGALYQAERFLLAHRRRPGVTWSIDTTLIRIAGDGAQALRDSDLREQLGALDRWRKEQRKIDREKRRLMRVHKERA